MRGGWNGYAQTVPIWTNFFTPAFRDSSIRWIPIAALS